MGDVKKKTGEKEEDEEQEMNMCWEESGEKESRAARSR